MFADAAAFNQKVKVFFLGIGSEEGPGTKTYSEQLTTGRHHERLLRVARHGPRVADVASLLQGVRASPVSVSRVATRVGAARPDGPACRFGTEVSQARPRGGSIRGVLMRTAAPARFALVVVIALLVAAPRGRSQAPAPSAGAAATAALHADTPGPVINRNIYGHFAEHLGRCIYEGIWVGEDSPDPQHARHPQRRRRGAEADQDPRAALAGRLLRRRVPLEGRHRPAREAARDDQHALGRRRPRTTTSARTSSWTSASSSAASRTSAATSAAARAQEMMEWVEYMTSDGNSPDGRPAPAERPRASRGRSRTSASATRAGAAAATCGPSTTPTSTGATTPSSRTTAGRSRSSGSPAAPSGDELRLDRSPDGPASAGGWTASRCTTTRCRPATGARRARPPSSTRTEWFATLSRTLRDGRARHQARGDHGQDTIREKRVGLIVDEWGTWYDVEPGTNPGFLYQQNTLRDALVAGAQPQHLQPALPTA